MGTSLVVYTTTKEGETLLTTVPGSLVHEHDWVVIGHGDADTLAAVVSGVHVRVWSLLTKKVVAALVADSPPTLFEFDLHVAVASFAGNMWISRLDSTAAPEWHAMCSASNAHSAVPCWPHVVVLQRDGSSVAVTNLSAELSAATAPAVVVHIDALRRTTARIDQKTRARSLGLHQTASREPALVHTQRTDACVGRLTIVGGVARWAALAHDSRRICLHSADVASLTDDTAPLHTFEVPWSLAHKDKYPVPDEAMCHVCTVVRGKEHVHVAYFAEDKISGERQQMITSVVSGEWHKTYVIAGSRRVTGLAATDRDDTIALLLSGGGHATLTTLSNLL